tara:strand:- start:113 stop:703 length:591 start_codon:yes stop_codon:yes gene_type:complete
MSQATGAYDAMSLITYTPRADSNDRGYEQWLIDVDNPFFNSSDVCVRYTNWKVIDDAGVNPGFSHFDFFGMNDRDSGDKVWNDEKLSEFRVEWRKLWGAAETLDPTANSIVNLYERVGEPQTEATYVIVTPADSPSTPGPEGSETWNTYNAYRGDVVFPAFHLKYADDPGDFETVKSAHAAGGPAAILAVLLAGPD